MRIGFQRGKGGRVKCLKPPPANLLDDAFLFLDFDGTLVPIAATPDAVVPSAGLDALLRRLDSALAGRLAIVSGRGMDDLLTHLHEPVCRVVASHGMESRTADGRIARIEPPADLGMVVAECERLGGMLPGVVVEAKPHGAALHYRQAPDAEDRCAAIARTLASRAGYASQPGDMVWEVRVAGADKGLAVAVAMADPVSSGTRAIFVGDDRTDEAGFAAAKRAGGAGVLVGPERESAATYRLPDVDATLGWLKSECRRIEQLRARVR